MTLTGGAMSVTSTIDIVGPGTNNLNISGGKASGIFSVTSFATATISGMTLTDANTDRAITNSGTLTVNDCVFSENYVRRNQQLWQAGRQ